MWGDFLTWLQSSLASSLAHFLCVPNVELKLLISTIMVCVFGDIVSTLINYFHSEFYTDGKKAIKPLVISRKSTNKISYKNKMTYSSYNFT